MNLTIKEKVGYGLGDTASCFVWATLSTFLLKYYTDTFGLEATAVGSLFLFARVFDGFIDFSMGAIADRTETRWGKFRPYLLWMCLPLAITLVLTFTVPTFSPSAKLVYAWITYNLLMIAYTAINIPYSALSGVMTDDPLDRTSLSSYRMVLSQVSGFIVNAAALPMIFYFGHGGWAEEGYKLTAQESAKGYPVTMGIFGTMAVILFLVCFATTKERIRPPAEQKTRLSEDLGRLFANPHWVMMFAAGMIDMTLIIVRAGCVLFYSDYYLQFNTLMSSRFLLAGTFGFVAGASVARFVVAAMGKKWTFVLAHALLVISCVATYLVPPGQTWLVFAMQVVHTFAGGLNAVCYWAMIADTADFSEWKFKVRTTGIVFSATTCSQKIGMGIGGWISGLVLASSGYVANAVQSAQANHGILLLVSLIPAAGFLIVLMGFTFYGLNEKLSRTICEDLANRRLERDGGET